MMLWLAIAFACDTPTANDDVAAALDAASEAFAGADLDAFSGAREQARAALDCLGEPLNASVAARFHRTEGLAAFFAEDLDKAPLAFASARRIEPDFRFSDDLVPPGNPLLEVYFRGDPFSPAAVASPEPAEGSLRFDGKQSLSRPMSGPTILQQVDGAGDMSSTLVLWPSDALPSYPVAAPEAPVETPVATKRSLKTPLLLGAAGAAVLSGALYGANVAVHNRYDNADDLDTLNSARGLNNGLAIGSGVTLAIGVGLGAGGLLVR